MRTLIYVTALVLLVINADALRTPPEAKHKQQFSPSAPPPTGPELPWIHNFKATLYLNDFFWKRNATGYSLGRPLSSSTGANSNGGSDFIVQYERFDIYGDEAKGHGQEKVSRIYNYTSLRQYTIDYPSKNCFWKPITAPAVQKTRGGKRRSILTSSSSSSSTYSPSTPPIPLDLAEFDREETITLSNGQSVDCYRYNVPVFGEAQSVGTTGAGNGTHIPYLIDKATFAPVLIGTGLLRVEFWNISYSSLDVSEKDFQLPSDIPESSCQGPAAAQKQGTIGELNYQAEPFYKMDPLLYPQSVGYLGGDGGQHTVLPPRQDQPSDMQRVYVCADDWEVGFQWLGQKMGIFGIIHNMVIVVESPTPSALRNSSSSSSSFLDNFQLKYYTGPLNGRFDQPEPYFQPSDESKGGYAWTNNALVIPASRSITSTNNRTMLMLTEQHVPGENNNAIVQLVISNIEQSPNNWSYEFRPSPFGVNGSPSAAGTQFLLNDGNVYIMVHTHSLFWGRNFQMARVTLNEALDGNFSDMKYFSSWLGWVKEPGLASTLFTSDAPCSTMFFHEKWKLYVALTTSGSHIGLATSANITGPYVQEKKVYQLPPGMSDGYAEYCPAAHQSWLPEEEADDILLTYFTNQFSSSLRPQTSPNSYEANFVKIKLSKKN